MDFENKKTEDQQEIIEKLETAENKEEKMFTQEQVNEIVKKRLAVGDFMSCRWSDFITGQQVASFFVIDSFR